MRRQILALSALSALASIALSCSGGTEDPRPGPTADPAPDPLHHGLTPAQAGEQLAKIGDRVITVGELADAIASKGPYLQARYGSPERRRELLDQMIRFELLAQEARREGLEDLPSVARTRKQVLIRRFLETQYEDRIQPSDVPDQDVRAYYESHAAEFHQPEQVRASHIFVRDRATGQRVLRQILDNPTDVRLFRELADRHDADVETHERFGDLRYFSRPAERTPGEPDVAPEVAEAAFALTTIGGVCDHLVEANGGFHVVKLTGRRTAMHRTLEEASRPIRQRLWRERRERAVDELVERLRHEADVQEDYSVLADVQVPATEGSFPTERPLAPAAPPLVEPGEPGERPAAPERPGAPNPR